MLFNMDKFCSKSTSSSSLGSPSYCLIWTSFAHSIILQNLPNKATFTAKLDRYDRVFVCRQISPIFLSQCGSFGNWNILCPVPERSILTALLVRAGAPATQYRPRCRIRLNSILCYQSDVSGFLSNGTLAAQFEYLFWGENKMMSHIMYNNPEWPLHFTGASLDKHLLRQLYLLHLLHFKHFKNCSKNKCAMLLSKQWS